MNDQDVLDHIEGLVAEEHRLLKDAEAGHGMDESAHRRLGEVKVQLDQAWDLLRQRRAHEEFGLDAGEASTRPADVVENYEQ